MSDRPIIVALCGAPKSGKSEVQRILSEAWGILPVDDKKILRDAAKTLYGLSDWHVSTQEGKATSVDICGRHWLVRELLGKLGNQLEALHGDHFFAERSLAETLAAWRPGAGAPGFSFGSVRRDQALVYRRAGAIVIEVTRPGAAATFDFDRYDASLAHVTLANDGTVEDLHAAARRVLRNHLPATLAAAE